MRCKEDKIKLLPYSGKFDEVQDFVYFVRTFLYENKTYENSRLFADTKTPLRQLLCQISL